MVDENYQDQQYEVNYNVYLYNEDNLVYSKRMGKNFAIQKGFDLSQLENGNYKVVLSSRDNEYVYSLVK